MVNHVFFFPYLFERLTFYIFFILLLFVIAVNGEWSLWNNWGSCTVACGIGIQTKDRKCDNPAPAHGGNYCDGSGTETIECNKDPCKGKILNFH